MSGPNEEPKPQLRGEAAWKQQKDQIDKRNAEAKKAGKAQREASERSQEARRHGAADREMARFLASHPEK
jgi:hypothetical protein